MTISSSIDQSSWLPSGRYRRMIIGIFLALKNEKQNIWSEIRKGGNPSPVPTPNKQLRWQLWCVKDAFLNPLTARVLTGVFEGVSNFWVCGRNPMMWPIKWKLSAYTYTWCCLFFKILQNEICKRGRNLPLATFGSERVLLASFFKVHFCCL